MASYTPCELAITVHTTTVSLLGRLPPAPSLTNFNLKVFFYACTWTRLVQLCKQGFGG